MQFESITQKEFNERVLSYGEKVCVASGAQWSGAFYLVQPAINDFIKKSNGKFKLLLLDHDSNEWLSETHGMHSHVPSIMMFENGLKTNQAVGITACLDLLLELQLSNMTSNIGIAHLESKLSEEIQGGVYSF